METQRKSGNGFSLIEVLVTIVIVSVGLLGLAGLQAKLTVSQMDSYQRAAAVSLLQDIVSRIRSNKANAASFVGTNIGTGDAWTDCSSQTGVNKELCEWSMLLKGSSETRQSGTVNVGAAIDMRGCIVAVAGSNPQSYQVSIAWRGIGASYIPAGLTCGTGLYGAESLGLRRVISTVVTTSNLTID